MPYTHPPESRSLRPAVMVAAMLAALAIPSAGHPYPGPGAVPDWTCHRTGIIGTDGCPVPSAAVPPYGEYASEPGDTFRFESDGNTPALVRVDHYDTGTFLATSFSECIPQATVSLLPNFSALWTAAALGAGEYYLVQWFDACATALPAERIEMMCEWDNNNASPFPAHSC